MPEQEGGDTIEFLCKEEYYEDAAKPRPASDELPEWFKQLEFTYDPKETAPPGVPVPDDAPDELATVRYCMSFLDAMTMGWIVPFPFDIEIHTSPDGRQMEIDTDTDFQVADTHAIPQLGRDKHPAMPGPIIKFRSPWVISTPENVSVLITHPMNRGESRYTGFSGVIESDTYYSTVNIPSLWHEDGYHGTIEAGTPMLQAIPFDRRNIVTDGVIRSMDPMEERKHEKFRDMVQDNIGVYRDTMWEPKKQARVVEKE